MAETYYVAKDRAGFWVVIRQSDEKRLFWYPDKSDAHKKCRELIDAESA